MGKPRLPQIAPMFLAGWIGDACVESAQNAQYAATKCTIESEIGQ